MASQSGSAARALIPLVSMMSFFIQSYSSIGLPAREQQPFDTFQYARRFTIQRCSAFPWARKTLPSTTNIERPVSVGANRVQDVPSYGRDRRELRHSCRHLKIEAVPPSFAVN